MLVLHKTKLPRCSHSLRGNPINSLLLHLVMETIHLPLVIELRSGTEEMTKGRQISKDGGIHLPTYSCYYWKLFLAPIDLLHDSNFKPSKRHLKNMMI